MTKELEIFTREVFTRKIKSLVPLNQRYEINTQEEAHELIYN